MNFRLCLFLSSKVGSQALLTTLLIAVTMGCTYAQTNAIKVDALAFVGDRFRFAYEQAFSRSLSAQLGIEGGTYRVGDDLGVDEAYKLSGLGFVGEVRYYPLGKRKAAPLGLFVSGAFRYLRFEERYKYPSGGYYDPELGRMHSLGIAAGYKYNYKRLFAEALLGIGSGGYQHDEGTYPYSIPEFYAPLLRDEANFFRAEISIGYLFNTFQHKD
jgi:hypothetical protein